MAARGAGAAGGRLPTIGFLGANNANDQRIAAAGAELVETWHAVAAVMKIEEAANRKRE